MYGIKWVGVAGNTENCAMSVTCGGRSSKTSLFTMWLIIFGLLETVSRRIDKRQIWDLFTHITRELI